MPPVNLSKKWLTAPDGNNIQLRPLSASEKANAKRIRSETDTAYAMKLSAQVGDVAGAVREAMTESEIEARRAVIAEKAANDTDPTNFDIDTIIQCGIVAWDYKDEDGTEYPCTPETRAELDDAVTGWAVEQILAMSARTPGNAPRSASTSVLD